MDRRTAYPFATLEARWQEAWAESRIFEATPRPGASKWLVLEYPPFPSGKLHMGHVRNYVIGDAVARFRRMVGHNVLYTNGFDAFGLPNDNAARERGCHPADWTETCIAEIRRQYVRLGLSHDTRRIGGFHEPAYYRWSQWIFLKFLEDGLAVRKRARVDWCDACKTTLARTSVNDGRCWRCDTLVESRVMDQWYVRESAFCEPLLESLDDLHGWPEHARKIQANRIGRVAGLEVRFEAPEEGLAVVAFTEHPELLMGAAFVGVDPLHPAVKQLREAGRLEAEIERGLEDLMKGRKANLSRRRESEGRSDIAAMALGVSVVHPLSGARVPLVAINYVESRTPEDAIVGVPAHQRDDLAVAEILGLPWARVLASPRGAEEAGPFEWDDAHALAGEGAFGAQTAGAARTAVAEAVASRGAGKGAFHYRLQDWNVCRQRYWGPPIPIVYCDACGAVPVPEKDLPVLLPYDIDLSSPRNPLEDLESFVHTTCPRCGKGARRETDTLETFFNSSWLHIRFAMSPGCESPFFDDEVNYWLPADLGIGGDEQYMTAYFHNRVFNRSLRRWSKVAFDEAFTKFLAIGIVKRDGKKMSKHAGNSIDPDDLIEEYGADALRLATFDAARPGATIDWSPGSIKNFHRFLSDVWDLFGRMKATIKLSDGAAPAPAEARKHKQVARWLDTAVQKMSSCMADNQLHLATKNVAFLFSRLQEIESDQARPGARPTGADRHLMSEAARVFLLLLAPLAPHVAEELWQQCGGEGMAATARWPHRGGEEPSASGDAAGEGAAP